MDLDFKFDLVPLQPERDEAKERIFASVQFECLEAHIGRAMAFRNAWIYHQPGNHNAATPENQNETV
jgi:hypothetical protein